MTTERHLSSIGYDAFISHHPSSFDATVAHCLQGNLRRYRVPSSAIRKGAPSRLGNVCLDPRAGSPAEGLDQETLDTLKASRHLIVICSPRALSSERIDNLVKTFHSWGRRDQTLALLVEGEPEDAFPLPLREAHQLVADASGVTREVVEPVEPLAADIRAPDAAASLRLLKTEQLRLIAPMVGCSFDDLKQRHRERAMRYWTLVASVCILASSLFSGFSLMQWRNAVEQERIATEQRRQAEAAYTSLTRDLPERFKDVPGALPVIRQLLEESEATVRELEQGQGDPFRVVEELLNGRATD